MTFRAASRDLKVLYGVLRDVQVQNFCTTNHITWKFIAERAQWWGGFWERLIRTVKNCLRKTLGKNCFSFEQLTTILSEVEAVVNSRPLTYLSSDAADKEVLTPSHFLCGRRIVALSQTNDSSTFVNRSETLRWWKHKQRNVNDFWKRWQKDYLLALRSAHSRTVHPASSVKVGDVVVVREDKTSVMFWRLGKVNELYLGKDGHVRVCKVQLAGGRELTRPVQLLCPLELCE